MTDTTRYVSACGKYSPGKNQVALTVVGDVEVSTIWWKSDGKAGDWFESLVWRGGVTESKVPTTYGSEAAALRGHAEIVTAVLSTIAA
jgi:hypothetical protein